MHVSITLDVERPRLEATKFSDLIDHYLKERARHLQPSTMKSYYYRLKTFENWWDTEGPLREWALDEAAFADFANHVKSLKTLGWSSQNDALKRLRQVLRWAHRRSHISIDFSDFVPDLGGSRPPRTPVDIGVVAALLEACEDTDEPERNQAIIAVLAGTAVRCEECCSLRVENVSVYEDGSGLIKLSVAKNDNLRSVAFDPLTGTLLCMWIVMLPYGEGPLFPSRNGRNSATPAAITPSGQHKLLRKIAEMAGVGDQIQGAHDLRRLFATTWAKILPQQPHLLQRQMGHKKFDTTLLYIQGDPNEIREAISRQPVTPISIVKTKKHLPRRVSPQQFLFSLHVQALSDEYTASDGHLP